MEERDKTLNRSPGFWLKLWEKAFRNKRIELTHRIDTSEYVLIAYKLIPETKGGPETKDATEEEIKLLTVLKQEKGKWLATQELAQDPVPQHWKTPRDHRQTHNTRS